MVALYFKQSVLFSLGQCEMTYLKLIKPFILASLLHPCQNTLCNIARSAKFFGEPHTTTSISLIYSVVLPVSAVPMLVFCVGKGEDYELLY